MYLVKRGFDYLSGITFIDVRGMISSKITINNTLNSLLVDNYLKVNNILNTYKDFRNMS